jgi:hypothetical protein
MFTRLVDCQKLDVSRVYARLRLKLTAVRVVITKLDSLCNPRPLRIRNQGPSPVSLNSNYAAMKDIMPVMRYNVSLWYTSEAVTLLVHASLLLLRTPCNL